MSAYEYRVVCGAGLEPPPYATLAAASASAKAVSLLGRYLGDVVEVERIQQHGPGRGYSSWLMVADDWKPWSTATPEVRRPTVAFLNGDPVVWPAKAATR